MAKVVTEISPRPGFFYTHKKKLLVAAAVITLLPLLFYTVSLLRMMAATITYPWELDQGEGHNVWSAWLLMQGRGPYLDLNHYPFFNINYPPLHFVLMIPLLWILGPGLAAGRLLADLCLWGLVAAVVAIVWRYGRNGWAAALAGLLVLASPYFYIFGIIASVNVSQVMFGAWALFFLGLALDKVEADGSVKAAEVVSYKYLMIGLILLLAALYTKQQAIDAVAAGFLFLLWRRPKIAIVGAVLFGLVGGGLFLLIDRLTSHLFYINLVKVNINDFIRRQLFEQGMAYILTHAPLLLMAAAYALLTLWSKQRVSLWLIYLVTTGVGSFAVGKFGAAETYFYSSIAAVVIVSSLLVARLLNSLHTESSENEQTGFKLNLARFTALPVLAIAAFGLLLIQNIIFYHTPETPHPWKDLIKGHSGNYVLFGKLPDERDRAAGQRLADIIKANPQPVLTEEASFAMVNRYEVVTNPSNILVYNQAKLWQGQELLNMVQGRCFSVILLHGHFLPGVVQDQIHAQYRQQEVVKLNGGDYVVWQRLSPPDPANAACHV
ncbi:MAG TPA: hypothetical protein VH186_04390 [Chloroflexia bacterium]|nr:hypothetical protein [Chloroflexia bacterium]